MISYPPISPAFVPGGRLSLTSATPVTTSDVSSSSNIYYVPYIHNYVQLWTGSYWANLELLTQRTIPLSSLTSGANYDIFGYLSNNNLEFELVAWSSDTARATNITLYDGRYCKHQDKYKLYLGSFRTISTTTTTDTDAQRLLYNQYNRERRRLKRIDTTDSWTYTTATLRSANNSTANRVEVLCGLESLVDIEVRVSGTNATSGVTLMVGIDEDGTNANDADITMAARADGVIVWSSAKLKKYALGYHFYQWVEYSTAAGTSTWYGDSGTANFTQSGMLGEVWQ